MESHGIHFFFGARAKEGHRCSSWIRPLQIDVSNERDSM